MNKIKRIIITIVILSSFSFGNLSKGQLIESEKMSWGIREFKLNQDEGYHHLFIVLNIDRNIITLVFDGIEDK